MAKFPARPRHLRPEGFTTKVDERKMLIMDLLRRHLGAMTREEITAALDFPPHVLLYNKAKSRSIDPLLMLVEEGKVEKTRHGSVMHYKADPDISKMLTPQRIVRTAS